MKNLLTILTISVLIINSLAAWPARSWGFFDYFSGGNSVNPQTELIKKDQEMQLEMDGIIRQWGYAVEKYDVTTNDGYILTIFRIPRAKNRTVTPTGPRPVVLIQHGFVGSSNMWVNNLPNQDAPFLYADAGYDVWLGNFRGNKYGKRHVKLSPEKDQEAFWDFSWSEMAKYDLPAMIDFILIKTGASNLYYMGHSMGTLTAFVAFSQDKELGKKVKKFYALAPVMKVEHIKGPMHYVGLSIYVIDRMLKTFGIEEFMASSWLTQKLIGQYICGTTEMIGRHVCGNFLFMIAGPSSKQLDASRLPIYFAHTPAGTSRRTFVHFGQMIKSGKLTQYNYGEKENLKRYNQPNPPEYDVSQMETPVGLFWGDSDWLATDSDVREMAPKLKNPFAEKYLGEFNHMDFLWGKRVTKEVYLPIMHDISCDFDKKAGQCAGPNIQYIQ